MNLNETKKRYHYLDVLKLLAIAFVVLYHHGAKTLFPSFLSDIMSVLSVCAPMFFFVNGALLFNKELDLKKHTKKTLKLVFVILFWSVILTFLLMVVRGDYLSFYEFLDTVLYLKNGWIHYLWFFRALLIIYVLFPMFKLLFDNHRKYFYFIFSLLLVLSVGESFSSTLQVFFNEIFSHFSSKKLNCLYSRIRFINREDKL